MHLSNACEIWSSLPPPPPLAGKPSRLNLAIAQLKQNNADSSCLDLSAYHFRAGEALELGKRLAENDSVVSLDLRNCNLGPDDVRDLLAGLALNRNIKILDLTGNQTMGAVGCKALCEMVKKRPCPLEKLKLDADLPGVEEADMRIADPLPDRDTNELLDLVACEQEMLLQRLHRTSHPFEEGKKRLEEGQCKEAGELFRQASELARYEGQSEEIMACLAEADVKIQAADELVDQARRHAEKAEWEEAGQAYGQALEICKDHLAATVGKIKAQWMAQSPREVIPAIEERAPEVVLPPAQTPSCALQ
ncbi:hypothetical protein FNU76_23305 [Chitinimonas arctica]|uniref:Tetratricopeptide repeat protein n=1 Tax=Chitinimonas arctica TaxID=2594795 RepID=A0A516SLL2_9NEIS|nr:hypothetical protein [Chitinimonas arctica]QDQ29039.1 hypothetical protein FNU76_23305 [Chitinimonas arctica]